MLEVEIAEELSKLEVAEQLSEKWSELLPPVLVDSSQEEEDLLEMARLEQEIALLKQQLSDGLRGESLFPVSQTVLSLKQFPPVIK